MRSHRINRGAIPRRSTGSRGPPSHGIVAQTGECLDGIEEVAGAIPADSTVSNAEEDYIRNYNGPKVATFGRPTQRWHRRVSDSRVRGERGELARANPMCRLRGAARAASRDVFFNLVETSLFHRTSITRVSSKQKDYGLPNRE